MASGAKRKSPQSPGKSTKSARFSVDQQGVDSTVASFGCSKCRWSASGCLKCNPEKESKWKAKKEAASLQKEAHDQPEDDVKLRTPGENERMPADQVTGQSLSKRLSGRGGSNLERVKMAVKLATQSTWQPTDHSALASKKIAASSRPKRTSKINIEPKGNPEIQTPYPKPCNTADCLRTPTPLRAANARTFEKSEGFSSASKQTTATKEDFKPSQPYDQALHNSNENDTKSAQDLKNLLAKHNIDFTGCIEKKDLQALWDLRGKSLVELRKMCIKSGCAKLPTSVEECVRFLLRSNEKNVEPSSTEITKTEEVARRQQDAAQESRRILSVSKWSFASNLAWGITVLDAQGANTHAVQRAYRALMKKLHPDRVGHSPEIADAIESANEARIACERALSQQTAPGTPLYMRFTMLCAVPGCRRIQLQWEPPSDIANARRYVVSVFDPTFNRAITVANLEPDYSEEMKRFVSLEELRSYVFAEEDLQKLPGVFQQPFVTLQVATFNEAGQSPWASLRVPLIACP
eukprot:gnl/MRDRNA2_/MRDRNA2_56168_c0_seq1.p1 gnl/MRDRNA2_/MRDRNA2_56168_c0~~gnl/MRDRNA2_/MRDRNA2_56168_c0_seq1.p1  ORF type:complete len:594 (+),score=101.57 gnl/MRDRNA2_/MRDRNA2_56168_c0_seq1:217-1782(+)